MPEISPDPTAPGRAAPGKPLTVVVTRPSGQHEERVEQLAGRGLAVVEFPLIRIEALGDTRLLDAALSKLTQFALVAFVSPNAIDQTMARLSCAWPHDVPIAVMGPGSVRALTRYGIAAPEYRVIAPGDSSDANHGTPPRYDSEALLQELENYFATRGGLRALGAQQVLLVRGTGGRELLGDALRAAGARLETVSAYRREVPEPDAAAWQQIENLLAPTPTGPHVWWLTSSEGVRNLDSLARSHLDARQYAALKHAPLVMPHARIAESARALGFDRMMVSGAGDANLVGALLSSTDPRPFSSMTDPKVSKPTPAPPSGAAPVPPNQPFTPYEARAKRRDSVAALWLVMLILLLGGLAGGYWMNQRMQRLQQQLTQRQQSNDTQTVETRIKTQQALDSVHQVDQDLAQLGGKVADTAASQQALQRLYQDLASNREGWTLSEIEQTLSSASEQLQLTGNVQLALFALQSADARLAQSDGPQMVVVRRAVQQDIERLKAAPVVDLTGLAIKLDTALDQVDTLPLAGEAGTPIAASAARAAPGGAASAAPAVPHPAAVAASPSLPGSVGSSVPLASSASAGSSASASGDAGRAGWTDAAQWRRWWSDFGVGIGHELAGLVQVRRIDNADAMLVAPDQGYFLRANLKLRVLSARLSLLARNQGTLNSDLSQADLALSRYFDPNAASTRSVRDLVHQVQQATLNVQVPNLDASLAAVRQSKNRS